VQSLKGENAVIKSPATISSTITTLSESLITPYIHVPTPPSQPASSHHSQLAPQPVSPFFFHFHVPAIAPSTNEFHGKLTTKDRIKLKIKWQHLIAREARKQRLARWGGRYPVTVECFGCFAKGARMYDADNLSATLKMIIDGLVTVKILAGDSPRFVRRVVMESVRVGEGKSRCVVVVREG